MFAQMLVTFELFDDHVEYVETDPEVRLRKCDDVFTVVWVDPYAVLKTHEPKFLHKRTQQIAYSATSLRDVEEYYTPATIPAFRLLFIFLPKRFKLQHPFPGLSRTRVPLTVSFFKRNQTLSGEAAQS